MEVVDHIPNITAINTDNLIRRKRMGVSMPRYAQFHMSPCNKSLLIFFSSRIVDNQPRSPSPLPLSPSVDIQPEYLINSSLSPSSSSQPLSFYLGENSKSLFRSPNSPGESIKSTRSEKALLMTGSEQSSVVQPLLTDLYQISMAYAYWKSNKHHEMSTFDLYFRKNRKPIQTKLNVDSLLLIV